MRCAALVPATVACVVLLAACSDAPSEPHSTVRPLPSAVISALDAAALGQPLSGLTAAQLAAFTRGRAVFEREFSDRTGLGPAFNASSCAECHGEPEEGGVTGAGGDEVETHFTNRRVDGTCDALLGGGGFVRQDSVTARLFRATGLSQEPLPSAPYQLGARTTVDLFGFGLLAAVADRTLRSLADPFDFNRDGISGRVHVTSTGEIGRFGRKAQEADLALFNAGAMFNEMGITNQFNPAENSFGGAPMPARVDIAADPELANADLDDLNAFVSFLAPPAQLPLTAAARTGQDLFNSVGCAGCHVPSLPTADVGVAALSLKRVSAFTDLLLHDMGGELADICLGDARSSEFRTEPLMGVRFVEQFMHDGRAATIDQAVSYHGGEGTRSRNRFANLSAAQRAALVEYVNSL